MSLTPRWCGTANLALHWEHQSHFNQGYWAGERLRRLGLRLLKSRLIRRSKGSWTAARPETQTCSPFATRPNSQCSDTDGILRMEKHTLMQTNYAEHLIAACGLHGKSLPSFLLQILFTLGTMFKKLR